MRRAGWFWALSLAGIACISLVSTAHAPAPAADPDPHLGDGLTLPPPRGRHPEPPGEQWWQESTQRMVAVSRGVRRDPGLFLRHLAAMSPADIAQLSLLMPSHVSADVLEQLLAGTGLDGLGAEFAAAESQWGVNALALVAIAAHESNWGRSHLARTRNNLFGFGAYTSDPDRAVRFASRNESVRVAARYIRTQYLEPDGRHHPGGTSLAAMGPIWAHDPHWAVKVSRVWRDLARRAADLQPAAAPGAASG